MKNKYITKMLQSGLNPEDVDEVLDREQQAEDERKKQKHNPNEER
jgi:hypothetical protein